MSEDSYDDGLVHGHAWATEPPALVPGATTIARPGIAQGPAGGTTPMAAAPQDEYDDGLVHSHSWACSERGQPAHRC